MISNQYQMQPNFQGNLLKEGLKFPQKKFNEVAKIYAEKTIGMPDLVLSGRRVEDEVYGGFEHTTYASYSKDFYENDEPYALITTGDFKQMFKDYSPIKIALELVNIAKKFSASKKLDKLEKEKDVLYAKMNNIRNQLKDTTNPAEKDRLQVLLNRIEQIIDQKEEKVKDIEYKMNYKYNTEGSWLIENL